MPSTVREVFADAGLEPEGCVRWCAPVPRRGPAQPTTGAYVVALTQDVGGLDGALPRYPLREVALRELLDVRLELLVDKQPATVGMLGSRIAGFWLPDEVVLYIGRAGLPLGTRVRQYYRTPLGARRPHAGGWWLKTLSVLPRLWVHYVRTLAHIDAEEEMLRGFASRVSMSGADALFRRDPLMPFANLRDADYRRKQHGIENATGPMQPGRHRAWPC